ncbi:MAG: bifunctional oligoribonuclease/PAP phosphatase NrnA [Lachnospiraceae bacterium]|nr:bifunctional oligoribonuclease/PAP phosphatase NrnA [Lachnospiraceae bacterium]
MKISEIVKNAETIGISGHTRPDGDCIGAALGLYLYLKKKMPEVTIHVFLEKPPEVFSCLAGFSEIKTDFKSDIGSYDAFFALDTAKDRTGKAEKHFDRAKLKINIDHHVSNSGTGDINIIHPEINSTCEVLFEQLDDLSGLDEEIAKALYLGIVHDTGVFRFGGTTPRTLEVAGILLGYGFDYVKLINDTYYEKTYIQNQILARSLLESIIFMDGRCIVCCLSQKILEFYGIEPGDLEGIVNQLLITKGVECAIFMHQTKNLEYKVSLRSKSTIDVSQIAKFFGGGGHLRAAGVTMKGTFHDIVNNISYHIEEQFKANEL